MTVKIGSNPREILFLLYQGVMVIIMQVVCIVLVLLLVAMYVSPFFPTTIVYLVNGYLIAIHPLCCFCLSVTIYTPAFVTISPFQYPLKKSLLKVVSLFPGQWRSYRTSYKPHATSWFSVK